jgi:glycosyltransferase 2 family protein
VSKYIRIVISVLLLTFIAVRTNWSDVADKFANLRLDLWFAAVGILVFAQVCSAKRWQLYARELRFEHPLSKYCAYYFVGMYFNLSLPTSVGGDVVRVWYLNGKSGRKWAAFASVFLERVNGLMVLVAMACLGTLLSPMSLPWWIPASVWGVAGVGVLGLASLPIVQGWQRLPAQRRQQLQTLLKLLKVPHVTIWATLMSVLVQLIGVVSLWFIGLSIGLDIPVAYYCILCPMVSLLTLLPISFNGMGLRELGMVVFLAPLDVSKDTATTLGVLWFAVTALVSLMGGLVYLFGAFPKAETSATPAQEGTNEDGFVDRDSDQGREGERKAAA